MSIERETDLKDKGFIKRRGEKMTRREFLSSAGLLAILGASLLVFDIKEEEGRITFPKEQLGINVHLAGIRWFRLNEKETIRKLFSLPISNVRIPVPFDEVSPAPGKWDFSKRDWIIEEAARRNLAIDLQLGIKTIGWPEIHCPKWLINAFPYLQEKGIAIDREKGVQEEILSYLDRSASRYLSHPNIRSVQVENEPFSRRLGVSNYRYITEGFNEQECAIVQRYNKNKLPFVQNVPLDTPSAIPYVIKNFDIIGFNVYNQHNETGLPSWLFEGLFWRSIFVIATAARMYGKQIFITEYQAASWGNEPFSLAKAYEGLAYIRRLNPTAGLSIWEPEKILAQGDREHQLFFYNIVEKP